MRKFSKLTGLFFFSLFLFSCSGDDGGVSPNSENRNAKVSITDAPIDNAEVKAAVVTISDVKVDGKSIQGFERVSVDLLALQNGNSRALGNVDLKANSSSKVTLILDFDADATGNFPGTYVETKDGVKHAIQAASNEININQAFKSTTSTTNEILIDFDLRKTITIGAGTTSKFAFVTMSELQSGIRVVNKVETATVSGTATDTDNTSDKIIVYAYKKGTFTSSETNGQGQSQIRFANAVNSSVVNNITGSYSLNFLEEGDYELHYASYRQNEITGEMEFNGMLTVESLTSIDVLNVSLSSGVNATVNVAVTGQASAS